MPEFFFIECDGKVFLIEKNNKLIFPSRKKEFNFKINILREFSLHESKFFFCEPVLEKYPDEWLFKKDALLSDKSSKIVKEAIYFTSFTWVVGRAVVVDGKGKMLVLKGGRGINKGNFTTPGGIVVYGETTQETALRECIEECGLKIEIIKLLGILDGLDKIGMQRVTFVYLCKPISGKLSPNMDDVVEAKWMPIKDALEKFSYYSFNVFKNWIQVNPKEAKKLTGFNFEKQASRQ